MRRSFLIILCAMLTYFGFAEEVIYEVHSKTSVVAFGDVPIGSKADFEQSSTTGKIGQMTEGNSTTLTIVGFSNIRIEQIILEMSSNKSTGAGSLQLFIGDNNVWEIEPEYFNGPDWNGAFSTSKVNIVKEFEEPLFVDKDQPIVLHIESLESSLYIYSYTFIYKKLSERPCTVELLTGQADEPISIKEESINSGVVLPSYESTDPQWIFIGWTENYVNNSTTKPHYYNSGSTYHPDNDTYLYALYASATEEDVKFLQDTTYELGVYFIVDYKMSLIMSGGVSKSYKVKADTIPEVKTMDSGLREYPLDYFYDSYLYLIDFDKSSNTCSIQNIEDESYVSPYYSYSINLSKSADKKWSYSKNEDNNTIFIYYSYDKGIRYLGSDYIIDDEDELQLWFRSSLTRDSLILFNLDKIPDFSEITYTCLAEQIKNSIKTVQNTDFQIRNGILENKENILINVYSIKGNKVISTTSDIDFNDLAKDIYIIVTNSLVLKYNNFNIHSSL